MTLKKVRKKLVPRGHLLVQRIFIGRQQLIREIIVLIDQYINLGEAVLHERIPRPPQASGKHHHG